MVVLCVAVKAVLCLQASVCHCPGVACQSCNVVLCFCCVISVISVLCLQASVCLCPGSSLSGL